MKISYNVEDSRLVIDGENKTGEPLPTIDYESLQPLFNKGIKLEIKNFSSPAYFNNDQKHIKGTHH